MSLAVKQLERIFNHLADIVSGPISQDNLPDILEFAATLLILREFMYHLRFNQIQIMNP